MWLSPVIIALRCCATFDCEWPGAVCLAKARLRLLRFCSKIWLCAVIAGGLAEWSQPKIQDFAPRLDQNIFAMSSSFCVFSLRAVKPERTCEVCYLIIILRSFLTFQNLAFQNFVSQTWCRDPTRKVVFGPNLIFGWRVSVITSK